MPRSTRLSVAGTGVGGSVGVSVVRRRLTPNPASAFAVSVKTALSTFTASLKALRNGELPSSVRSMTPATLNDPSETAVMAAPGVSFGERVRSSIAMDTQDR
jgi:hypothetical protein